MRLDGLDINKEIKLSILFGDEIDKVEEEQENKTKQNKEEERRPRYRRMNESCLLLAT